ncbi:hypothetical protein GGF46_001459 [Coemansia sp. RSA 552]|nr:hypothetical protein GGF46_001459 [Coemansia sp. RSA 552]
MFTYMHVVLAQYDSTSFYWGPRSWVLFVMLRVLHPDNDLLGGLVSITAGRLKYNAVCETKGMGAWNPGGAKLAKFHRADGHRKRGTLTIYRQVDDTLRALIIITAEVADLGQRRSDRAATEAVLEALGATA